MQRKQTVESNLSYLNNPPKKLKWKVVAGPKLPPLQKYDLIFDETDLKIRKMNTPENLASLKKLPDNLEV